MQCSICGAKTPRQMPRASWFGHLRMRRPDSSVWRSADRRLAGISPGVASASQQWRIASQLTFANECSPVVCERGGSDA
jgi:hypothetical protein